MSIADLDRLRLPGNNACRNAWCAVSGAWREKTGVFVKKQILTILLKYGLGLGIMIFMISRGWHNVNDEGKDVGIAALFRGEHDFHWLPLTLALVICGTGVLITFFRWFILVRAQGLPFTPMNALRLGLAGFFWSTFLPGSVTGDIPKAYFLAREHSRRTVAVATVIIDRIIGLCALFWVVAFLGSIFWISGSLEELVQKPARERILQAKLEDRAKLEKEAIDATRLLEIIVIASVGLVVANVVFWLGLGFISVALAARLAKWLESIPRVGHSLAELWRAVLMYRSRGKSVLIALVMAMAAHIGFVLTFYLCALTLYAAQNVPSVGTHYLIVPIGMTFQGVFPTPGGLGGGEAAFSYLYVQVGAVANYGLMACLMKRVIDWTLAALAYVAWLLMKPPALELAAKEEKDDVATDTPVPELATGD